MDKKKIKRRARYALIATIFVGVFIGYAALIFPAITWVLEHLLDAKLCWNRAPFFKSLFLMGIGLLLSILIAYGTNNIITRRRFFHEINWPKLLIVVFCFCMFGALSQEADKLIPQYANEEYDDDERSNPAGIIVLAIVALVGYAMWPKHTRDKNKNLVWKCYSCGNTNPVEREHCVNPSCSKMRYSEEVCDISPSSQSIVPEDYELGPNKYDGRE